MWIECLFYFWTHRSKCRIHQNGRPKMTHWAVHQFYKTWYSQVQNSNYFKVFHPVFFSQIIAQKLKIIPFLTIIKGRVVWIYIIGFIIGPLDNTSPLGFTGPFLIIYRSKKCFRESSSDIYCHIHLYSEQNTYRIRLNSHVDSLEYTYKCTWVSCHWKIPGLKQHLTQWLWTVRRHKETWHRKHVNIIYGWVNLKKNSHSFVSWF